MCSRKSIRLKEFDYSLSGYYYTTIKTYNNLCLFGRIIDGVMHKNTAGKIIEKIWKEIPQFYNGFEIHEFIIMPNHLHGIIEKTQSSVGSGSHVRPEMCNNVTKFPRIFDNKQTNIDRTRSGQAWEPVPTDNTISLFDLMCRFKTMTTNKYIKLVKQNNAQRFYRHLWQRSYYERIIRNKYDLDRIKKYIRNNPINW